MWDRGRGVDLDALSWWTRRSRKLIAVSYTMISVYVAVAGTGKEAITSMPPYSLVLTRATPRVLL